MINFKEDLVISNKLKTFYYFGKVLSIANIILGVLLSTTIMGALIGAPIIYIGFKLIEKSKELSKKIIIYTDENEIINKDKINNENLLDFLNYFLYLYTIATLIILLTILFLLYIFLYKYQVLFKILEQII